MEKRLNWLRQAPPFPQMRGGLLSHVMLLSIVSVLAACSHARSRHGAVPSATPILATQFGYTTEHVLAQSATGAQETHGRLRPIRRGAGEPRINNVAIQWNRDTQHTALEALAEHERTEPKKSAPPSSPPVESSR